MADAATTSLTYNVDEPAQIRRGFLRQTIHDTFGQLGAKIASVWLLALVVRAVLAPFIASTHPILMKADGKWSSPMWQNLTPPDLILSIAAIAAVILWKRRGTTFVDAMLTLIVVIAFVGPAAYLLKKSPASTNYQMYRDMEREGRVESIFRTLIPYSPTDRMRDMPEFRLTRPMGGLSYGTVTTRRGEKIPGIVKKRGDEYIVRTKTGNRVVPPDDFASITRDAIPIHNVSWLGTETDGADLLSRMIHASRIALSIGLISTTISLIIGILVGGMMGYFVGKVDLFGMRLIEVFEAIPTLLVLITVMAAYERNIYLMMAVIGLLGWTGTARFIRAEFLRLRNLDFVQAAIAGGVKQTTIIYRHILPNGLTPILVTATFGVASAILTESTLSFLGLGLIDEPSWGQMLNQARSGGQGFVWWMAIFPGAAIFLTVYAYALIGDSMRDALDPKLRKRD